MPAIEAIYSESARRREHPIASPGQLRGTTITLILTALVWLTGCTTNPVTGKTELALIGDAAMIQQGAAAYAPLQQQGGGLYTADPGLGKYVHDVTARVTKVSAAPLDYDVVVLNDSTPNAWALPGGKLAVNRGLLMALENEAELAAVIGHEIVHAAARHGGRRTNRNLLLQGVLAVTNTALEDNDFREQILDGFGTSAQVLSQSYSRGDEFMADEYGMEYMHRAGYDPAAAVTLQQKFVEMHGDRQSGLMERLFASHPPSPERVRRNQGTLARLGAGGDTGQTRYQRATEYLRAKLPAYRAFDRGTQLLAAGEQAAALASAQQAIQLEPKEARFHGLLGEIHLTQAEYGSARNAFNAALERDDNFYLYYLGRGQASAGLGQTVAARKDFQRSMQLLPNAVASNELGKLTLAAGEPSEAKIWFREAASLGGAAGTEAANAWLRIDVTDAPSRHIEASGSINPGNGAVIALVTNRTNLLLTDVIIEFHAVRNGRQIQQQVRLPRLGARAQVSVGSGWTYRENAPLGKLMAVARSARVP